MPERLGRSGSAGIDASPQCAVDGAALPCATAMGATAARAIQLAPPVGNENSTSSTRSVAAAARQKPMPSALAPKTIT